MNGLERALRGLVRFFEERNVRYAVMGGLAVRITQGRLDEAYLRHWAQELGVLRDLEQALCQQ